MDQAERGIGQDPHFDLLAREGFVEGTVSRERDGWRFFRAACTPTPAECCLGGHRRDEVLWIEFRVADDSYRPRDFRDGFPSNLEQTGPEIASNAIVGSSPCQALAQHRMIEPVTPTGMSLQHQA